MRKPGAFARCRFREQLFPTMHFRLTYDALSSTLRILSGVNERGCNSMVQGSRKFLDISVGSG